VSATGVAGAGVGGTVLVVVATAVRWAACRVRHGYG
jgi:hypothetical protein